MRLAEAMRQYHAGAITEIICVPEPTNPNRWRLELVNRNGGRVVIQSGTPGRPVKQYSTLDAVAKDVEKIAGRLSALHFRP